MLKMKKQLMLDCTAPQCYENSRKQNMNRDYNIKWIIHYSNFILE